MSSYRFVRCPHCKMPHGATERVCPNTGLTLPIDGRSTTKERRRAALHSQMAEVPPPERRPSPLTFDPRERAGRSKPASREASALTSATGEGRHDLTGQVVGGRYRIKGVLGEGGMGTVFDAEHLGLTREVAIKVLSPTQAKKKVAVKRFQQEARAAGGIGHPNICEVYDLGLLDDGSPYLVMEKLVGQTLAERIAKEGGLPFEDVIDIVSQVLSGLVAAHDKGIVHRDIKPENIFLARRIGCPPIVKLLDFGVSKMMPEFQVGEDALDLTRTGMVMGTPYYMSPEQARGERNLDGRVDVYACGVVMYEALAGRRPFLAPNYNALLLAIISTRPPRLREVRAATPPALEAIIDRAMAKNRADRFSSASAFLRELKPQAAVADGSGARLPPPPTPEERKRAQVLGGGRARPEASTRRGAPEPAPRADDGPAATLRSRMVERPSAREDATRVDLKVKPTQSTSPVERPEPRLPALSGSSPVGDDSLDIPIDFSPASSDDIAFDDPTEVFQPKKHPGPRAGWRAPPIEASATSPSASSDDWDGETAITHLDFSSAPGPLAPAAPSKRGSATRAPRREARPFNAEETMKLDDTGDLELLDDADATRTPRR